MVKKLPKSSGSKREFTIGPFQSSSLGSTLWAECECVRRWVVGRIEHVAQGLRQKLPRVALQYFSLAGAESRGCDLHRRFMADRLIQSEPHTQVQFELVAPGQPRRTMEHRTVANCDAAMVSNELAVLDMMVRYMTAISRSQAPKQHYSGSPIV